MGFPFVIHSYFLILVQVNNLDKFNTNGQALDGIISANDILIVFFHMNCNASIGQINTCRISSAVHDQSTPCPCCVISAQSTVRKHLSRHIFFFLIKIRMYETLIIFYCEIPRKSCLIY